VEQTKVLFDAYITSAQYMFKGNHAHEVEQTRVVFDAYITSAQ
jgi:hypothetical protein